MNGFGKHNPGPFGPKRVSAYVRKTVDEFTLQGLYCGTWEDLTAEDSITEIHCRRDEYRANEPGTIYRIVKRRVKRHG